MLIQSTIILIIKSEIHASQKISLYQFMPIHFSLQIYFFRDKKTNARIQIRNPCIEKNIWYRLCKCQFIFHWKYISLEKKSTNFCYFSQNKQVSIALICRSWINGVISLYSNYTTKKFLLLLFIPPLRYHYSLIFTQSSVQNLQLPSK